MFQPYDERALVLREPRAETPVTDFLRAGRARISNPVHWCQGRFFEEHVRLLDHSVFLAQCSLGALYNSGPENLPDRFRDDGVSLSAKVFLSRSAQPIVALADFDPETAIALVNDHSTHPEVMAMWDRAISMAERAGA